jgi:hypothetical protein
VGGAARAVPRGGYRLGGGHLRAVESRQGREGPRLEGEAGGPEPRLAHALINAEDLFRGEVFRFLLKMEKLNE